MTTLATINKTQRQIEEEQRKLLPEHQSFYVCFMAPLSGPQILGVFDTDEEAQAALPGLAQASVDSAPRLMFGGGPSRLLHEHMVRQQHELDYLAGVLRGDRNEASEAYYESRRL